MATGRFIFKLLIFSLPLSAGFLWLECRMRTAPNSYQFKQALIEKYGAGAEVLIFGTSHAYYDFNPAKFTVPGLNLANTSQSLVLDQQIYTQNVALFAKVRVLVLNLSYFSFEYRLYGNSDDYREFSYIHAFGIEGDGGWRSKLDPRRFSSVLAFGPEMIRKILFNGFGSGLAREISQQGWMNSSIGKYPHLPVSKEAGRDRAQYHSATLDPSLAESNLEAIAKIVEVAEANGAKVVLSQAPASIYYTQALDPEAERRFHIYIDKLQRTLGLEFHDYLRDKRFAITDFYDNDHLNAEAAGRFSTIFDREVLAPILSPAEN